MAGVCRRCVELAERGDHVGLAREAARHALVADAWLLFGIAAFALGLLALMLL